MLLSSGLFFAQNLRLKLSNIQPHFPKFRKQLQAEMENGVAFKKNV
jgi:hypothetical protein